MPDYALNAKSDVVSLILGDTVPMQGLFAETKNFSNERYFRWHGTYAGTFCWNNHFFQKTKILGDTAPVQGLFAETKNFSNERYFR